MFSTSALNSLNLLNTSLLAFKKQIQVLREKSSINETKYTYTLSEVVDIGPHVLMYDVQGSFGFAIATWKWFLC
jgi:hypothetical protein